MEELPRAVKCVIVGDGGVGKTSLVICYITNVFPTENVPARFHSHTANLNVDGMRVDYELCDTNGEDEYAQLRSLCYTDTDVFLLCFSITDPSSFKNVQTKWLPELKRHRPHAPIVLVGTKQDLKADDSTVRKLKDQHLTPINMTLGSVMAADIRAVKYVECSALERRGVKEAFDEALSAALETQVRAEERKDGGLPALCCCWT